MDRTSALDPVLIAPPLPLVCAAGPCDAFEDLGAINCIRESLKRIPNTHHGDNDIVGRTKCKVVFNDRISKLAQCVSVSAATFDYENIRKVRSCS